MRFKRIEKTKEREIIDFIEKTELCQNIRLVPQVKIQ